jgi:hypothetical protein
MINCFLIFSLQYLLSLMLIYIFPSELVHLFIFNENVYIKLNFKLKTNLFSLPNVLLDYCVVTYLFFYYLSINNTLLQVLSVV